VALAAAVAVVVGIAVTTSSSDEEPETISVVRVTVTPTPASTSTPTPTPEPTPSAPIEALVHGFRYPIEGACLPSDDDMMPNAPREYRYGVHEGIDFYSGGACALVERGTPVLAAKTGVVIRVDHDYQEITLEEMDSLLIRAAQQGYTDAETLDRLRGRQVWIDHGDTIVTRYAHLLAVDEAVQVGQAVGAGQVVGYVGNSGTPEGVTDPTLENHLHFEIRVGSTYLGEGLSPSETRYLCGRAFSP
jgi:murein DD-endopeptidase MepM/ murein hydrolase activator NlpD